MKNLTRAAREGSDLRTGATLATPTCWSAANNIGTGAMGQAAPEPPHPSLHLQCLQQHALGAANRSTGCTGINAVQKTAIRIQTNRFMQEDANIPAGAPA